MSLTLTMIQPLYKNLCDFTQGKEVFNSIFSVFVAGILHPYPTPWGVGGEENQASLPLLIISV